MEIVWKISLSIFWLILLVCWSKDYIETPKSSGVWKVFTLLITTYCLIKLINVFTS